MKVLVVDDVVLNQQLIIAAVKDLCDGEVIVAERATKAIELAITEMPDLIFMDIGLPDLDGFETTELIKGNPITCHIPIVVVSAHAMTHYVERAKRYGCDGYITKPIEIAVIRKVVESYSPTHGGTPMERNLSSNLPSHTPC
jgi:two-component system cell cycle response regulator DivK